MGRPSRRPLQPPFAPLPRCRRRQGSSGEASGGDCSLLALWRVGRGLPPPWQQCGSEGPSLAQPGGADGDDGYRGSTTVTAGHRLGHGRGILGARWARAGPYGLKRAERCCGCGAA
jgi:hypothetical protein